MCNFVANWDSYWDARWLSRLVNYFPIFAPTSPTTMMMMLLKMTMTMITILTMMLARVKMMVLTMKVMMMLMITWKRWEPSCPCPTCPPQLTGWASATGVWITWYDDSHYFDLQDWSLQSIYEYWAPSSSCDHTNQLGDEIVVMMMMVMGLLASPFRWERKRRKKHLVGEGVSASEDAIGDGSLSDLIAILSKIFSS